MIGTCAIANRILYTCGISDIKSLTTNNIKNGTGEYVLSDYSIMSMFQSSTFYFYF